MRDGVKPRVIVRASKGAKDAPILLARTPEQDLRQKWVVFQFQ